VRRLLLLAGVPESFIPYSDWQTETSRWAPSLVLTADITKPEGVAKLIGELAILGLTIWWDDVDQEIKLRINRPVDTEIVQEISDRNSIITASQEDRDQDRITQVLFNTVQINPTSGGSDAGNYRRGTLTIDAESILPQAFGDIKIKEISSRWLNQGADSTVRILSLRLLNRFKVQPKRWIVEVDWKDDVNVADVIELTSDVITDDVGELQTQLAQVIMREDIEQGHKLRMTLQKFQFDGRYGFITENTRPVYSSSSEAQKARGAYIVDEGTLLFGDGTGPYLLA
jgi:hypothetical protein